MKEHKLKSWPEFFEKIIIGEKKHELRKNHDREFSCGDVLILQEYKHEENEYTGREQKAVITYITDQRNQCALSDIGLNEGYNILSIELIE